MQMLSRFLLIIAAGILLVGGIMHAMAFDKTVAAAAESNLPPFYANSFLALWLIDSVTLIGLGLAFALAAMRPRSATPATLAVLALIPAGTAGLLYYYLGPFFAAHLLVGAAACGALAALLGRSKAVGT
jgi:F0F1-type ATP synthase membrane subunit c/vacuolar-type H+-ATPase subunit K